MCWEIPLGSLILQDMFQIKMGGMTGILAYKTKCNMLFGLLIV